MVLLSRINLILQLFFYSTIISALPPLALPLPTSLQATNSSSNDTGVEFLSKELTSFPPGPPSNPFYYTIPDTDLAIHFAPLGLIRGRNETLVTHVLRDALISSLDYRTTAKMPGHGYQLQAREFLLSISHSAGTYDLTWGMWTIVLTAMTGYVHAYPGYDFMFEVELIKPGAIMGYIIGAGFAMTRG